jgi:FkbM family methyltransferase
VLRLSRSKKLLNQFIHRTLRRFGVDIGRTQFNQSLMGFVADRAIDTVLDVGANVGQFGAELRGMGYRGKIVSFEPIASVYQALTARTATDGAWEANNFALGAAAGQATIHVAEGSEFSSILQSARSATRHAASAAVTRLETIEVRTLDGVCHGLKGNILLKIDTQGFEQQVLQGGRSALPMMKGVLLELPVVHLYEGAWRLHEAIAFMEAAGFVPAQIWPVSFHSVDAVSLVEADCLFRPLDPRVD